MTIKQDNTQFDSSLFSGPANTPSSLIPSSPPLSEPFRSNSSSLSNSDGPRLEAFGYSAEMSCTIFYFALPFQIPSLFPLVPPCSNVSRHSVTPSPPITPITLHHSPSCPITLSHLTSFSVTLLHFSIILYHFPSSL